MGAPVDIRRRGLVIAALAGGGVLIVTVLQSIVVSIGAIVAGLPYSSSPGDYLGIAAQGAVVSSFTSTLPFGAGVFLSLWQFAPIAAPLRIFHVVSRSVLAAGVGAVGAFVVGVALITVTQLSQIDRFTFVGAAFPGAELLGSLGRAVGMTLLQPISLFVTQGPLVILAGISVWLWARGTDRRVELEGALDL